MFWQRDKGGEEYWMNPVVLRTIPGYQHNLISDRLSLNVWALFIHVHWGLLGQEFLLQGSTPLHCDPALVSCMHTTGRLCDKWLRSWLYWRLLVTLHKSHLPCHISTSLGTFGLMFPSWYTGNMYQTDVSTENVAATSLLFYVKGNKENNKMSFIFIF